MLLKQTAQTNTMPDFAYKYQHDPHSVAQFLYEILAASEKGILSKIGQGLVESADINLDEYPGLLFGLTVVVHYSLLFLISVTAL